MSYEADVRPIAIELLNELFAKQIYFIPKATYSLPVDIYTEAIMVYVVNAYKNGKLNFRLPNECFILLLIRYPYFINILQCGKTFSKYEQFRKELLVTLDSMFPMKTNEAVINVQRILSTNIVDTYDIDKCSVIHFFHYFIGFTFIPGKTTILKDQLPVGDGITYFIIHLSYNLSNTNAIVLYKDMPKVTDRILNADNMHKYKCVDTSAKVYQRNEPFECVNTSFTVVNKYGSKVYILLCYDDAEQLADCHFTIASFGESGYVDERFIHDMVRGSLPKSIELVDINNTINTTYLKTFSEPPETKSTLRDDYNAMMRIAVGAYEATINEGINDLRIFDAITNKMLIDDKLYTIIDKMEAPYFRIYMKGAMPILSEYLGTEQLKELIGKYAFRYIHDNISNTSKFHD